MRTKLALLLALSTGAELLILDEPMSGLDPAATEEILQILVKQAGHDGSTVLFSSHQLADVEQIADHIAIVDRGRVVIDGALDDVRAAIAGSSSCSTTPRPTRVQVPRCHQRAARGRVLSVLSSGGEEGVVAEARSLYARLRRRASRNAQRNLSRSSRRGELKCSGTNPGSIRAGVFCSVWRCCSCSPAAPWRASRLCRSSLPR